MTVMVESPKPKELADSLANNFAAFAELLSPKSGDDPQDSVLSMELHRGIEILTVELVNRIPPDAVQTPASRLASGIQPSFATLGNWVLLSTHPQAIRQILDAEQGWIPRLGEIRELGLGWKKLPETRVSHAVAQPAMASAVVSAWRNVGRSSSISGLPSQGYGSQRPSIATARRPSLGIAVKPADRPGSVLIVRVHADKPANGKLRVGDQIISVNGQLLDSNDPVDHLRQLIENDDDQSVLSFGIRRNQRLLDVAVPLHSLQMDSPAQQAGRRPLALLDRLQKLGRLMSYGTYTVYKSRSGRFHARLMFQLTPGPARTPTSEQ